MEIAEALDPLKLAMAAGKTPSPQMVADCGGKGGLHPWIGLSLLTVTVAAVFLAAWLNEQATVFARAGLEKSPRQLISRSRELLSQLGYIDSPADTAYGLATDHPLLKLLSVRHGIPDRTLAQPPLMYFWYRQSPSKLVQQLSPDALGWGMPGRITPTEPPFRDPGMTCMFLDADGRLLEFHAVPPRELPPKGDAVVKWDLLLKAAGVVNFQLVPDSPVRAPSTFADEVRVWTATYPDLPKLSLRVEAAGCRGRPVYFFVGIEGIPERLHASSMPQERGHALYDSLYTLIGLGTLTLGASLAWRNWRLRRANLRGAYSVALCLFVTALAGWTLTAHHTLALSAEYGMLAAMAGAALLNALTIGLVYLGVEPSVRQQRPWQAIGWNRLLQGRWRDPWVGRDLLVGALVGVLACVLLDCLWTLLPAWTGRAQPLRAIWDVTLTEGAGVYLLLFQFELLTSLRDIFLFYILSLLLRRTQLAAAVWVFLMTLPLLLHAEDVWLQGPLMLLCWAVNLMVLIRFGMLAYSVSWICGGLLKYLPITTDSSAWYSPVGFGGMILVIGLAFVGFMISRAGHSFFADD
jgi:serine/threonine-protein kinase